MIYYTDDNLKNFSIAKDRGSQEEQLEEFRCRWYKQSIIIQKVIELEKRLGYPPDLWDLYTSGKFTNAEIDFLNSYVTDCITPICKMSVILLP
jgi:hypothetical protein